MRKGSRSLTGLRSVAWIPLVVATVIGFAAESQHHRPREGLAVSSASQIRETATSRSAHLLPITAGPPARSGRLPRTFVLDSYGKSPLRFEPNSGQFDPSVRFLSRSADSAVLLTEDGAMLAVTPAANVPQQPLSFRSHQPRDQDSSWKGRRPHDDIASGGAATAPAVLRMHFCGANPAPRISGDEPLPGKVNYFFGGDPKTWRTGIATYGQVRYEGIYAGIDMVYHGSAGRLEYDFIIKPGADLSVIGFRLLGAEGMRVDRQGTLRIRLGEREVIFHQPRIYQTTLPIAEAMATQSSSDADPRGRRQQKLIAGRYGLKPGGVVGFQVGPYDHGQPLVIDPVLTYSTYLGGSSYDSGAAIAVDSSGAAYITGFTLSDNFPVSSGAYHTHCGTAGSCNGGFSDVFITKLSPAGNSVVYSTYLGGSKDDIGKAIAVDGSGAVYVTGETFSSDFPTTSGAFGSGYQGNGDAFVVKLSANGSSLQYSSYLGGSGNDEGYGIAVDSVGNAYVTGQTYSTNFPTVSPLQSSNGGNNDGDAFVTEVNPNGSSLVYSTYLGGEALDRGTAIAVDPAGNAYVTGLTKSANFPVAGPLQGSCASCPGYADAFVAEISSNGAALAHSTYLGGSADDQATAVALDTAGNIYVTGFSLSTDFPTTSGAYQTSLSGGVTGAFVTKIASGFSALAYSTYVHGNALDFAQGIGVDSGNVFITGQTYSTSFPLANAFQSSCRSSSCFYGSVFVTELNAAGSGLIFSSYLGGTHIDQGYGIALDSSANPYIAGEAGSSDFPTANAFQASFGGSYGDAFVSKIGLTPAASSSPASLIFPTQTVGTTSGPQTVTLTSNGTTPVHISGISVTGDFPQSNNCGTGVAAGSTCAISVTFKPTATGTRSGTLSINDNASGSPQTVNLTGTGSTSPAVTLSPISLTFNSQAVGTTSPAQPVTLANSGSATLTINNIGISGTNVGDFAQTNNCGTSLAASSSCTINVTFAPTAAGLRSASVSIADNASGSPQTVSLTGTGSTSPAVTLSPISLTFISQALGTTSPAQPITLTNSGSATLTINSIGISGANAGDFAQTNNCGTSLAASLSCIINVTFTPTASGSRSASVSIADNASNNPQTVGLTGTGSSSGSPGAGLSPASLAFSSQTVGTTSAAQPITLTDSGSATLTINSIGITGTNASDFAQTNNCPGSLAASGTCTINITFTPTASGSRSAAVTVTDNAAGSPHSVTLSGTGASGNGSACTKFVSPSGSDSASGSVSSPWQHLQKAFNSSVAGDVVCLRAGTYPSQSTTTYSQIMNNSGSASSPITIQNYPGETAVVQGNTRVNGAYVIIQGTAATPPYGLVFQIGSSGLSINGMDVLNSHDVTLDRVEITGFDYRAGYNQYNGCNNKILGSYIHDNGKSVSSDNGINWGSTSSGCASGGLIANNVVEHNASLGLQLYSGGSSTNPSNVVVEENTFVSQGAYGVVVWGDNNVIANNIAYGNGDIQNDTQGALHTGSANIIDHNVTFSPTSGSRSGWYVPGGCCVTNNLAQDPLFTNPSGKDWHLTSSSPAIGYSNTSYVQTVDKDGVARGPGYDAGAYQHH